MRRALTNPLWLVFALVAALVFTMVGGVPAIAYDAENHVGDLSDTGVTNPATGDFDMDGNAIDNAASITFDGGGQWKAGTSDDMVCLQEVDTADDNVCLQTAGDELYVYLGNGGTLTNINVTAVKATNLLRSAKEAGGELELRDTTTLGDADGTGIIEFQANDSGGAQHNMAKISMDVTAATAGSEMADMVFESTTNGVDATEYMRLDASAGAVDFSKPIVLPTFTKSVTIPPGASGLGPTAPSWAIQDTLSGLEFDAAAEVAGWTVEIDDCWDGISDMALKLYLTTETGDVIANTEVVEFDCTYRSLAQNEPSGNGTAVTVNPSYTQSGAGTDSSRHQLEAVIDFDSANQPLAAGDMFHLICNRDVGASDTYSGAVILEQVELEFQCTTIPNH